MSDDQDGCGWVNVSLGTLKMLDMNLRNQIARVENARHENAAPCCRGGKREKRDSMEHHVLHMSVHCRAGMSTRKSTRFRRQLCSCE